VCLAGITATLLHYLKDEAEQEIPIVKMMSLTPQQVKGRAETWIKELGQARSWKANPQWRRQPARRILPTFLLSLSVESPDKFLKRLRQQNPAHHCPHNER